MPKKNQYGESLEKELSGIWKQSALSRRGNEDEGRWRNGWKGQIGARVEG
jgi:hypothetical protein